MTVTLHKGDLPPDLDFGASVAIDTETMGLMPRRDRLCLVQLSSGDGTAHLVQFERGVYAAPNLCRLLTDPGVLKIFHYGRFDIATMLVASGRLHRAGLLHEDRFQADSHLHRPPRIARSLPRTDRGRPVQAAADFRLGTARSQRRSSAPTRLPTFYICIGSRRFSIRFSNGKDRVQIAQACFRFLPTRARLDLMGWLNDGKDGEKDRDLFSH